MTLKKHINIIIFVLILQYLLGMITNLFVHFPDTGSETELWEFAKNQLPLVLHVLVGISLLIGSASLVVRSFRQKKNSLKITSLLGLISIFVSAYAGTRFVSTQSENYSFIMSLTFASALLSYIWSLFQN